MDRNGAKFIATLGGAAVAWPLATRSSPAIASDRGFLKARLPISWRTSRLRSAKALNESQLCRGSKRDDQIPLLGKRLSARN